MVIQIKIFSYIFRELFQQVLATMIIFCAIIVISQLVRLSEVLVTFGLSAENILLPFLYIILPFLSIIVPIALFFGVMMVFARLSSDGELTALSAAGGGIKTALYPLMLLSTLAWLASTYAAVHLEAWGRREFVQFIYRKTQTEIDDMIRFKIQPGVFLNEFLDYTFYTESVSKDRTKYENVLLGPRKGTNESFLIASPRAEITGSVLQGDLKMVLLDGLALGFRSQGSQISTVRFQRAEVDLLRVFQEKIVGSDTAEDDYRSYPLEKLASYQRELANRSDADPALVRKVSYLYYSRFANSSMIFALALLAMVLSIHDVRRGKGTGYLKGIATVILCFVVMVAMRWIAEHGGIPIVLAVTLPQFLLGLVAVFCTYQKMRLPPSEAIFSLKNMPFRRKNS